MTRFSTTLDVSKELKGFEDDSGDEIEEDAETSNSEHENKPKKGRNYAEEFETYDREEDSEEDVDDEMENLDSEFNGKSEAKTVSEDQPEKIVVEEYNVKKKQKAEFVDADEIAEPKNDAEKDDDDKDDDSDDEGDDDSGDNGREPRKVGGGKGDYSDDHKGKTNWLWASILIILIIVAGTAGYLMLKNARQHAAETNLSGFPEQIAKDNELAKQNVANSLDMSVRENMSIAEPLNSTAENKTLGETAPVNKTAPVENNTPAAPASTLVKENNESALKNVLIQGLS